MRLLLAGLVLVAGCQWNELVNPTTPPKPAAQKCYVSLYSYRRDPVTGAVVDSAWLGSTEVPCKAP